MTCPLRLCLALAATLLCGHATAVTGASYRAHVTNPSWRVLQPVQEAQGGSTLLAVGTDGAAWRSTDGSRVFAATASGDILASGDGARTWQRSTTGTRDYIVRLFLPPAPGPWLAVGNHGLILRSEDRGRGWQRRPSGSSHHLAHIAHDPLTRSLVIVGDQGTLPRSGDAGRTWQAVSLPEASGLETVASHGAGAGYVAAGAGGTLLRSADGLRWEPAHQGMPQYTHSVVFDAPTQHWLAFGVDRTFARSADGLHWSAQVLKHLAEPAYLFDAVAERGGRGVIVAGGQASVLATRDGGLNWRAESSGTAGHDDLAAVPLPSGRGAVLVGTRGAMCRVLPDGLQWLHLPAVTSENLQGGVGNPHDHALLVFGDAGTLLRSGDAGQTWQRVALPTEANLRGAAVLGPHAVLVGDGGTLLRSADSEAESFSSVAEQHVKRRPI